MFNPNDELDEALMHNVSENPGATIIRVIEPFLLKKSENVLRQRIRKLALQKKIRTKKGTHTVQCFPIWGKQ